MMVQREVEVGNNNDKEALMFVQLFMPKAVNCGDATG